MNHPCRSAIALALLLSLSACSTPKAPDGGPAEKGRDGTIAYQVLVESNEPGVRIEVNNDYVGTTPVTIKVYGDKDGTFHNFGSPQFIIRALPVKPGQNRQSKIFRTGGWFSAEDTIPRRIFFDMSLPDNDGTGAAPPRY